MYEVMLHGPLELLPPMQVSRSELIITGSRLSDPDSITYVILDDVPSGIKYHPTGHEQFVGSIIRSDLSNGPVVLDITAALNRALPRRPNFYVSFLTEKTGTQSNRAPAFDFDTLEITHQHSVQFDHGLSAEVVHH